MCTKHAQIKFWPLVEGEIFFLTALVRGLKLFEPPLQSQKLLTATPYNLAAAHQGIYEQSLIRGSPRTKHSGVRRDPRTCIKLKSKGLE